MGHAYLLKLLGFSGWHDHVVVVASGKLEGRGKWPLACGKAVGLPIRWPFARSDRQAPTPEGPCAQRRAGKANLWAQILRIHRTGAPNRRANRAHALARAWDKRVNAACYIGFPFDSVALPITLSLRHAGPAAPVDTGTVAAVVVLFTSQSVTCIAGPDRGAAPAVAKPVTALAVVRATALGHVLGPGSLRTLINDSFIERRELVPQVSLMKFGARQWAIHRRPRRDLRRCRRRQRKRGGRRRRRR
jgi:hypothetical protein